MQNKYESEAIKPRKADISSRDILQKSQMLREGNISLILDSYDDIFSDFDPRPYSEKALSDDFLNECRKATRDKGEEIELRLLAPKAKRNANDEASIKKRLKAHFQRHFLAKEKHIKLIRKEGLLWFFVGIICIFLATLVSEQQGVVFTFIFIILEPAGWFTCWTGLEQVVSDAKAKLPEYEFYKKMARMEITFHSY